MLFRSNQPNLPILQYLSAGDVIYLHIQIDRLPDQLLLSDHVVDKKSIPATAAPDHQHRPLQQMLNSTIDIEKPVQPDHRDGPPLKHHLIGGVHDGIEIPLLRTKI